MKYYRLTYLISPELSGEEAKNVQQKINSLVQSKNGILTTGASTLMKRSLGAPIQKKNIAYLSNLDFGMEVDKTAEFQQELKAQKEILRFMFIYQKPVRPESEKKIRRRKPEEKGEKVELKEIEDKLEEILDK